MCLYDILKHIVPTTAASFLKHPGEISVMVIICKGKSTTDKIFGLWSILSIEKRREYQNQTHHLFVNVQSAYDSIHLEPLYQGMIHLVKLTLNNVECVVAVQGNISEGFTSHNGVRIPWLFSYQYWSKKTVREWKNEISETIINCTIQILDYADDLDIVGRAKTPMKEVL